jgi:DNA-directed RNA polymerase subunit K/omega
MPDSIQPSDPESAAPPAEPAPPIESRFLFVDVAAQRANQLRRGARLRLASERTQSRKLERAAMEEVKQRLVGYTLPKFPTSR